MSGIAITFPSSPSEGQTYLAQNGFTYIYDSQKNRWKRGGDFVRAPKVLSFAGVAVTTTGSGITTGPTGALIYNVPGFLIPSSDVGVDSYKAYRYSESYPNYTEIQVSISSAFNTIAYAATSTSTTFSIPAGTLSGDATYYVRARQFVGSDAASAGVGAISGYSANIVSFATTSTFIDAPVIVSIAGDTDFPVYQIGFAGTTLPATATYTGSGVGNLDRVDWRVTGPRIPSSTGDTALAEVGIGTHSSATLANALVLALPFSGATGVGITSDVNNAIRTASGASSGTTKTVTANGNAGIATIAGLALTSHFYDGAAYFDGSGDFLISTVGTDTLENSTSYTIEGWTYINLAEFSNNQYNAIFITTNSTIAIAKWRSGLKNNFYFQTNIGGTAKTLDSLNPLTPNSWFHWAAVRDNNTVRLYINGILQASDTVSGTNTAETSWYIARNPIATTEELGGYIQDLKIYKGLAKYTENFTPPLPTYGTISYTTGTTYTGINTTAYYQSTGDVGIAETSSTAADALVLAMPMNRTFGFQDINVAIRGLTSGASAGTAKTVGLGTTSTANAPSHPRISVSESKWYDGAAYFDGSKAQYAIYQDLTAGNFGTGDFTVEYWAKNSVTNRSVTNYSTQLGNITGSPSQTWRFGTFGGVTSQPNKLVFAYHTGSGYVDVTFNSTNYNDDVWHHYAAVRRSGVIYAYVDGINVGSATVTQQLDASKNIVVGAEFGNPTYYYGYIQDIKIYKGFAKYAADFTPPQPICGFSTDISTQTGFTTTTASGALLSSVVGLGSTSTLAFDADTTYAGITSITSSSGITTLPDPYAQNLVLALPLANITGAGNSFTNDRAPQIEAISLVTVGAAKTVTNVGVSTVSMGSTSKWYSNTAYFNGSQYITVTNSSDFEFGSGDFTIECWIYSLQANNNGIVVKRTSPGFVPFFIFGNTSSVYTGRFTNSSNTEYESSFGTIPLNTWNHLALVKRGDNIYTYTNGVLIGSRATTGSALTNSDNVYIGSSYGPGTNNLNGYIQDLKIYKGTAKYTTNFTPPPPMFGDYTRSTPNKVIFTPSSDYVLEARNTSGVTTSSYSATRQWGTKPEGGIYDPYAGNLVLAIPGGAVGGATTTFDVTGQIKFETPTATYSSGQTVTSPSGTTYTNKSVTANGDAATSATQYKYYGRSIYLDGTGDYLQTSAGTDFVYGTSDFTVEAWVYPTSSGEKIIHGQTASGINYFLFLKSSTEKLQFIAGGTATTSNSSLILNTWSHVCVARKSGIINLYINGILEASASNTADLNNNTYAPTIGSYSHSATNTWSGYIQDLKIYKGFAKYTSNFTPPNQIYLT